MVRKLEGDGPLEENWRMGLPLKGTVRRQLESVKING